jgi:tetratricopeptide (TPR) repeat protein
MMTVMLAGSLLLGGSRTALAQPFAPPAPVAPPPPFVVPAIPAVPPMPPLPFMTVIPPMPPLPPRDFDFDFPDLHVPDFDHRDFDFDLNLQAALPQPRPVVTPPTPTPPRGQPRGSSEELYSQAREFIDRARYERALEYLDRVATMANSARADAALYWKGYAQWKLDQRADALGTLADMRKRFPESRWSKDAQALDVEIRQASGQSVSPDGQASEELKLLALRGLMNSDPDRAIPMIEQLLAGPSTVRVKENALFVLSQSRSARAREIIAAAAKGSVNPDLQLRAVRYIGAIGGTENRQALDEVYRSTTDTAVKRAVIRSLGSAGDRQRLLALAKTESAPELRAEAVRSLGSMNAAAELDELYQRESSTEVKGQIIRAMVSAGNIGSLTKLATTEKDPGLRRTAIRNLGAMGSAKTADTLRSIYTSNAAGDVKNDVIDALSIQQNAAILVALARAEKDATLKRRIVERLSTMKSKEATDYMLELLK